MGDGDILSWLVLLTFLIGVGSSTLSGMGGGGGGFVTIPYFLFIGLTPAHALATAKMGGIGTSVGAITAFRGKGLVNRKLVIPFMLLTVVFSMVSAWLIPRLDPTLFQRVIGVTLIVLTPTLFIKKAAFQPGERSRPFIVLGFICYALFSFLQTLIGTGMGSILVLVLMFLFGLGALEANATKRVAQSVQGVLLFVLLGIQGFVLWWHGLAGLMGSLIGSHIGTHIAIKKGARFVKIMLAVVMCTSGIGLLW
ncbi:MAG TPA: sulfite exporter TauE/SafE family protein [Candidatus Saccharimonadales bacterium]|nr:sulfite exporter TauE/SafE family protein [Candidatus Saccharimonadales bacterium]